MSVPGPNHRTGPPPRIKARRVLVVQPDREEALRTAQCIQGFGHVVACLTDPSEAIDLIYFEQFDMIVVEWPHGRDIATLLAPLERLLPRPKVIILTSVPTIEQKLEANHRGADYVISRPVAIDSWKKFLDEL